MAPVSGLRPVLGGSKMKTQFLWGIFTPVGNLMENYIRPSADEAVARFMAGRPCSWEEHKNRGYEVRKLEIREATK
jgi:hypothetical protein